MKDTTTVKQNGIAKFMKTMNPTEKIDTLICCGLIYHLLSLVTFLKRLPNVYKPRNILFRNVGHWTKDYPDVYNPKAYPVFMPEKINVGGMRYSSDKRVILSHIAEQRFCSTRNGYYRIQIRKFNNISDPFKDRVVIFKSQQI